MNRGELTALWERLRAQQSNMPHFLREIRVDGIRGVRGLAVELRFPVCVLAGPNGSGKSTALLAAACAYNAVDGPKSGEVTPARVFPNYAPKKGSVRDQLGQATIQYSFATPDGQLQMQWRRGQHDWARNFAGKAGAKRPSRPCHYREMRNLNNPSEVRDLLELTKSRQPPKQFPLNQAQVGLSSTMFPATAYREVTRLTASGRNMLFANQQSGPSYSEFNMSSGERVGLRLGAELGRLKRNALVLIDEVEAGLHPAAQRNLMAGLLQLALRHDLQIIVTTHSPVVLDCVPPQARVFLNRGEDGRVRVDRPYRPDFQSLMYGREVSDLTVLCEDDVAAGVVNGILDYVVPAKHLPRDGIRVADDVPAERLLEHAQELQRCGVLNNYLFALDGARRGSDLAQQLKAFNRPVLFLPGQSPEEWAWEQLSSAASRFTGKLGFKGDSFNRAMSEAISPHSGITATANDALARARLELVAAQVQLGAAEVCRVVAAGNAEREAFDIRLVAEELHRAYRVWSRPDVTETAPKPEQPSPSRHRPRRARNRSRSRRKK